MFSISYVWNELRRRWSRTVVTAFGLAAGVGLVMGIVGVSQGLSEAQTKVLSPLGSVGTDILVTRTVGATTTSTSSDASASPSASASPDATTGNRRQGGGGFFGNGGGQNRSGAGPTMVGGAGLQEIDQLNDNDQAALLNENSSVITDLSKLGPAGTKYTHDFFVPGTLISFPDAAVATVASIPGVTSAVGGLTLQAQHQSGTVPKIVAQVETGGQTLTTAVKPDPLTEAEQEQVRSCLEASGVFSQGAGGGYSPGGRTPGATASPGTGGPTTRTGGRGAFGEAFTKCQPKRFQEYQAQVVVPLQTIQQIVNPPATDTNTRSYSAAGVDPAQPDAGLVTKAQLVEGDWFTADSAKEVLVNTAYASTQSLKVGDTLPINDTDYTVVGLVSPTLTGNVSDLYFSLDTMQTLADKAGRVNEVLVKANKSADVDAIAAAIQQALPGAQVVTTKSLADQVTGSLSDARKLSDKLGSALAVIVLLGAFLIAALLTLSSVAKRVREIGTLRALGWSRGRVVRQIVAETVGIGLIGGVIGLGVGVGVCALIGAYGPSLSATSSGLAVGASSVSSLFNQSTTGSAVTSAIQMQAPIHLATIGLGLAVAVVGGLLAGAAGGWRAARLAPVTALRDLG